jgi:ketosteroid isomerase-like protein
VDEIERHFRALDTVATDVVMSVEALLAIEPGALLFRRMHSGVDRSGGGRYEREFLFLAVGGADGRLARVEWFDLDQEAEALARFDALTAAATGGSLRRVRRNLATETDDRAATAIAAADSDTLGALFGPAFEEIHHPTGSTYGRAAALASIERLLRSRDARFRTEPLATLGSTLALVRQHIHASGARGHRLDVGEFENESFALHEVDAEGRYLRHEVYERAAERLPDGAGRERAAVTARAVAYILLPGTIGDLPALYDPRYKDVDHRLVGYGEVFRDQAIALLGSLDAIAEHQRFRIADVLALSPRGFVRTTVSSGTWRDGCGPFERTVCTLTVFGDDGRVTGHETFEADQASQALARFDALTGAPEHATRPARVHRRVAPNDVTRCSAECERIVAERDFAALATFFAEDAVGIDHPTGTTYGAEGLRAGTRHLMQSPGARWRSTPWATLGPSWGLFHREMAASGAVGARVDVGPYEIVDVAIYGSDPQGRIRHCENFALDKLRSAITRLYECYAESLPEGPARTRAARIARTTATDGVLRNREEWVRHAREQAELAAGFTLRDDDVLALGPDGFVVRQTCFGTSRASGGPFEHVILMITIFDGEGLVERNELFEPDQEAAALARFDALTAAPVARPAPRRRVRPNAATRSLARFAPALATRDAAVLAELFHESLTVVHHPTVTTYGRREMLGVWKSVMRADRFELQSESVAALGEHVELDRHVTNVEGWRDRSVIDFGRTTFDEISVIETDGDGRWVHCDIFAADRLDDAIVALYERYAGQVA